MNGPQLAVGAVVVHGGSLLLLRRGRDPAAGEWSVPGGRVHLAETLHAALVREVFEETGLAVVVDRFLGWVERIDEASHFVILDFAATALDPSAPLVAGDDAAEVAWVALQDVASLRLVDGLYEFLHDAEVLP